MNDEINLFKCFTSKFDLTEENLKRKYEHTYRVAQYAEEIATSLNLKEKEVTRAKVCALFHDIGRFPQFKEYKTFIDSKSFDHGDKAEEILIENNYFDDIVLKAVKYHNKKNVLDFDKNTNMHINIVRDADKLDIMNTQVNELTISNFKIPKDVLNCFKNHELVNNTDGLNNVISLLRMIAFIFDINYKKTIELILKKDIINRKLSLLVKNGYIKEANIIEKEIKKYIYERFDIKC